jgi:hypothetical protein
MSHARRLLDDARFAQRGHVALKAPAAIVDYVNAAEFLVFGDDGVGVAAVGERYEVRRGKDAGLQGARNLRPFHETAELVAVDEDT